MTGNLRAVQELQAVDTAEIKLVESGRQAATGRKTFRRSKIGD